jgi:hydroxypyruvate isomerase
MMKRRKFLTAPVALTGCAAMAGVATAQQPPNAAPQPAAVRAGDKTGRRRGPSRVRQSVMGWCFNPMDAVTLARHAQRIGLEAIEGIPSSAYDEVKELGLEISLVGSHGFAKGPLNPDNHPTVEAKLREGIDLAVRYGAPNVITFTGMKEAGISDEAARRNCLACWKRVIPYAEEKGVGIVLEHLNSRDNSHPMKGHPGYWGDDLERCVDLVRAVDSPRFRLLFDIYHVQIMHGDLIRNIRRYHELVGHYHTAGNPGRGELDEDQEINYPAVMRAIVETGYRGYVAQEFIPTADDPIASLRQAYHVCDV